LLLISLVVSVATLSLYVFFIIDAQEVVQIAHILSWQDVYEFPILNYLTFGTLVIVQIAEAEGTKKVLEGDDEVRGVHRHILVEPTLLVVFPIVDLET
jgi:hypothetical protein